MKMANSIKEKDIAEKYKNKINTLSGKSDVSSEKETEKELEHPLLNALQNGGEVNEEREEEPIQKETIPAENLHKNPIIKKEVKNFLIWIENQDGLASYVKYYLDNNDYRVISDLSRIYNQIRNILGA
ncbi:MAG: hypothetical protein EU541_03625 [Promethearchaeota archaeon]|nr:MAG: hypothetical protein EU541_03625 [Candidatus Lokiarchaeota archaeon]